MKLVVALCLLGLMAVNASFQLSDVEHIRYVSSSLQDTISELDKKVHEISSLAFNNNNNNNVHQLQLTTACQNAYSAFVSQYSTCMNSVQSIYDASVNTTKVDLYCQPGGCRTALKNASLQVVNACSNESTDSQLSAFTSMVRQIDIPCLQDSNGAYCWPAFWAAANATRVANLKNGNYTKEILDTFCVPCTRLVTMAFYAIYGASINSLASSFDAVCMQANGEYCMLFIQNNPPPKESQNPQDMINWILRVYCDNPCASMILRAATFAVNSTSFNTGSLFDFMCAKDGSTPCLQKIYNYMLNSGSEPAITTVCPSPTQMPSSSCNASCATEFDSFKGALGCCLSSYVGLVSLGEKTNTTGKIVDFFRIKCNKQFPENCAPRGFVRASLAVRNLLYSYYVNNKASVELRLKNDIAVSISVDVSSINVTGAVTFGNGTTQGVKFSIEITASTLKQAEGLQASLDTQISTSKIPLPQLSSLPAAALADPTATVTFDGSASQVQTTSSGSLLQSSTLFVLSIAMIALTSIKLF